MKIDFTKVLKNFKGDPLKNDDEVKEVKDKDGAVKTKGKPATVFILRDAALNILLMPAPGSNGRDAPVSGKKNLDRYQLAERIYANDIVDITSDQRDLIKDATTRIYPSAMVSGQVWEMLERTAVVEEKPLKKAESEEKQLKEPETQGKETTQ